VSAAATEKRGDRVYTPRWVAEDMVRHFQPTGRILEPFRGGGVFMDLMPGADWCEIDDGRDFFEWSEPVDWIVTNPPYSKTRACFAHAAKFARDVVFLLPLRNVFSGFGFIVDIRAFGGIAEIRTYGTGTRLGFPMGNAVGAIHFKRAHAGAMRWSHCNDAYEEQAA
jgi:hypothetical protein